MSRTSIWIWVWIWIGRSAVDPLEAGNTPTARTESERRKRRSIMPGKHKREAA